MIRLHHVPHGRSFRVMWLMEELGLDYDVASYSIRDGSMRTPEFYALSPAGRVPALEIGSEVLFESGAIVETLCERHAESGLMPAPGDDQRARALELLHYAETMCSLCENLNLNVVFLRDPAAASPVVIKLLVARLRFAIRALIPMIAGEYLLGARFSAADIMIGYNFLLAERYVDLSEFDEIIAYRARLEARPAYQRALARNGKQDLYSQDFYPVPEE